MHACMHHDAYVHAISIIYIDPAILQITRYQSKQGPSRELNSGSADLIAAFFPRLGSWSHLLGSVHHANLTAATPTPTPTPTVY